MAEAKRYGENGNIVQLEVNPQLAGGATHSRRSLREAPVRRPEAIPFLGTFTARSG
jgi:hypothetical protein